jgi:hypothetical protein
MALAGADVAACGARLAVADITGVGGVAAAGATAVRVGVTSGCAGSIARPVPAGAVVEGVDAAGVDAAGVVAVGADVAGAAAEGVDAAGTDVEGAAAAGAVAAGDATRSIADRTWSDQSATWLDSES